MNGYRCMCVTGYVGSNCETNRDECATTPCLNGATCTVSSKFNLVDQILIPPFLVYQDLLNGYTCSCPEGYFGLHCETNIDDCLPRPCIHGGTCIDLVNGYRCQCAAEFTVSELWSPISHNIAQNLGDSGLRLTNIALATDWVKHVCMCTKYVFIS